MLHVLRSADSFKMFMGTRLMFESKDLAQLDKLIEMFAAFDIKVFVYEDPGYDISDW